MSGRQSQETYAAGLLREFLNGDLAGKPNEVLEPAAGLIGDPKRLRLIMHYRSLWPIVKTRDEDNELPETFGETKLARRLVGNAGSLTMDDAVAAGNVSQMQGAIGLTGREEEGDQLIMEAARRLQNEGTIALTLGPPGSGKTSLTLDITRVWAALTGGHVIGNTSWDGFDAVVTSDREALEYMGTHEGPVLLVLDETAQDLSGFGEDSKKAERFSDALTFVRKREEQHGPEAKRGSVLMVNHTRTKTAKPFRDLCTFAIEKPSRTDPGRARLLDSEGGKDEFEEVAEHRGLSDTREDFAEHEASEFTITEATDEQGDEQDDGMDPAREQAIRTALKAVKPWDEESGMSYADAADLVPWGDTWVGDRAREWKRGEHRDLVAAPNGGTG